MVSKAWKLEPEVTVNLQVRAVRELNSPSSCTLSLLFNRGPSPWDAASLLFCVVL